MARPTKPQNADTLLERIQELLGETVPPWMPLLRDVAPDMLLALHASNMDSLSREESTLPRATRHLVALAAALAAGHSACAKAQAHMAILEGASEEEVLDVVRIARHMACAGALDNAEPLLREISERRKRRGG